MTTAAQALEALNTLADAAIEILWTERCLELSQSVRQHIESTAAELEALRHDVAHALMAATAEAEHADEIKAELEALRAKLAEAETRIKTILARANERDAYLRSYIR